MKNIFSLVFFIIFAIGFGQKKPVVKKEPINEVVASPVIKTPVSSNGNGEAKGDLSGSIDENVVLDYSQIFEHVELQAKPKGGIDAFRKKITASFRLPEVDEPVPAKVTAKFVIWDDGSIQNIQIMKEEPSGLGLGREFVRLLKLSEKWTPAQIKGKNVKQFSGLTVSLQLKEEYDEIKPDAELINESTVEKIGYVQPTELEISDENIDYSQIFNSVQVSANPPGGMNAYRKKIASSFTMPKVEEDVFGTIVAKFVVMNDGSIKDVQILRETPINLGLGKELTRLLTSSDKWTPGIYNGRNVNQYYTLPISIQITAADKVSPEQKKE